MEIGNTVKGGEQSVYSAFLDYSGLFMFVSSERLGF